MTHDYRRPIFVIEGACVRQPPVCLWQMSHPWYPTVQP